MQNKEMPYKVKIKNVVATAALDSELDLWAIYKEFTLGKEFTVYNPSKFPGLIFKLSDPKASFLMFNSGKIICTGTKSSKLTEEAVLKTVKKLRKRNLYAGRKPKISIRNIVATIELPEEIDLEDVHYNIASGKSMYDPEQFPALIYRMTDPEVVFLLFNTGKIICAGAKKEEEVYRAADNLYKLLEKIM